MTEKTVLTLKFKPVDANLGLKNKTVRITPAKSGITSEQAQGLATKIIENKFFEFLSAGDYTLSDADLIVTDTESLVDDGVSVE